MFLNFFLTEIKYTLKSPMIYIFLFVITLLVFGATVSDNVQIGYAMGNIHKNSPYVISVYTTIMSIFGLIMATAFFNNAALRDHLNKFNEILFSTPITKASYFSGRFLAALVLSTIPLTGVFLGVILGTVLGPAFGWIDASRFGDLTANMFVTNYLVFILPNMFIAGAIIFPVANKWKSTVISFTGSLIILMTYLISNAFMTDIENETLAALTDTFGVQTFTIATKYFTVLEKNTVVTGFNGLILWNRIIWLSLTFILLTVSFLRFSFREKTKKIKHKKHIDNHQLTFTIIPAAVPTFNRMTVFSHFKTFFRTDFTLIIRSITFRIILLFSIVILAVNLGYGFEYFGLKSYPLTYRIIDLIRNSSTIYIMVILVFFSGELVWRDRDVKINEIIDSTPHSSFISLAAKALSLVAVSSVLYFAFVFTGIIFQLSSGYTRIEPDIYLLDFLYNGLAKYFIFGGIMITVQVLSNNKYVGYFISVILIFIWSLILLLAGIESNMMIIGGKPSLTYSDMNGFGPGVTAAVWFNLYWLLFSLIALQTAGFFWSRGLDNSLIIRFKKAFSGITPLQKKVFFTSVALWIVVAGYVYYNTHIINRFYTSRDIEKNQVEYEKKYKKYEHSPTPKITSVKYDIDIYPYKRNVFAKAGLVLKNTLPVTIDSLHFTIDSDWHPVFKIPDAKEIYRDDELGYIIFGLEKGLKPGDSLLITIETKYITKGFKDGAPNTSVVKNGTFLNNYDVIPTPGYNSRKELQDKNKRKKHGLPPRERMPALQENCSEACQLNYLTKGSSDFITVETEISTAGDQTAIAPGSLMKEWKENGRNHYKYKIDHPSLNFYSFISARYQKATEMLDSIILEVYYDKKHSVNIPKMLNAEKNALKYYTKNFGPYYHKECRIIEFPRYAIFAQAFPGTMPYSEGFGFVMNLENEEDNNIIDAVIAHEIAHQWWAHQVVGAWMQGCTMLSESFAEYSSLMTMKSINKSPVKMRKFLKYDHDRYLKGRSREFDKEVPLYKVENQSYIHYGKGSVVLYALQDFIGEQVMNKALRNFLNRYKYNAPPYPTTLDFLHYLEPEVPDSLKYLITDFIKGITLYDNRMKSVDYVKKNNKWEVTVNVQCRKMSADSIGREKELPLSDYIDIGFFADNAEKNLFFEKRVFIDKPQLSFTFLLDTLPAKAAIDPRHLLIDRVFKDNIISLK